MNGQGETYDPAPAKPGTKSKLPALPPLVSGASIAAEIPEIPDEVVHNLLHKGCKMVIGGGSKSFKTWTLADLAISISTGSPWWGMDTAIGNVVYLNFEIHPGFFHKRLQEIATAKNVELSETLQVWNLRGYARPAEELIPDIIERLGGMNLAAIIIDPIYKLGLGKDENATKDQGQLLNEFDKLAVQTGAAVAYGAHFSKGNQAGKEAMDRISGSGVHARDPDAIVTLTRHAEDAAFTVDATLRNCPPIPSFVVRWDFPLMVHEPALDPAQLKQARGANGGKRAFTVEDIINVMPLGEGLKAGV